MGDSVRLVIDGAEVQRILRGPEGPVFKHISRLADRVIDGAHLELASHNRTGNLSRSIVKRPTTGAAGVGMKVIALADYAYWVHEGNGPPGGRIYPTHHVYLRFVQIPFRPVFAKSVRATTGIPFLRRPFEAVMAGEH